ncbi:MAG: TetR/AcrR family transcriptional regulator [Nocardioides sp.]
MGHKYTRDDILAGALETAFENGLSQISYGRVARRLGTSDRVIVYYFPTTTDLVRAILLALGTRLQRTLEASLATAVADHTALIRTVWPVLADSETDRVFALYFEASGLAAAGRAPYDELVPQLMTGWIDWAMNAFDGTPARRQVEAETAIALVDGLLLLRQLAGPAAADRAAGRLGARSGGSSG